MKFENLVTPSERNAFGTGLTNLTQSEVSELARNVGKISLARRSGKSISSWAFEARITAPIITYAAFFGVSSRAIGGINQIGYVSLFCNRSKLGQQSPDQFLFVFHR